MHPSCPRLCEPRRSLKRLKWRGQDLIIFMVCLVKAGTKWRIGGPRTTLGSESGNGCYKSLGATNSVLIAHSSSGRESKDRISLSRTSENA